MEEISLSVLNAPPPTNTVREFFKNSKLFTGKRSLSQRTPIVPERMDRCSVQMAFLPGKGFDPGKLVPNTTFQAQNCSDCQLRRFIFRKLLNPDSFIGSTFILLKNPSSRSGRRHPHVGHPAFLRCNKRSASASPDRLHRIKTIFRPGTFISRNQMPFFPKVNVSPERELRVPIRGVAERSRLQLVAEASIAVERTFSKVQQT